MSSATMTSKGQITIPKEVRLKLGIDTGDRVEFIEEESGVFKIVAATQDVTALKGIVSAPKQRGTLADMDTAIKMRVAYRSERKA